MKRLLLPLLSALALPTAINAQSIYLNCDLNEQRSNNYAGEQKLIGGKIVTVPNLNFKFSDWEPLKESTIIEFTLNEKDQKGSMFNRVTGVSEKIPLVNFQSDSILISKRNDNDKLVFEISRLDGSIYRQIELFGGTMILESKGSCKKAEPKKTLF